MKLHVLIYFTLIAVTFAACEDESDSIIVEDIATVEANQTTDDILRILSDAEVAQLENEFGLGVTGGNDEKAGGCRWKDDLSGTKYGTVGCHGGTCTVVQFGSKIGIACVDNEGNPKPGTSAGAWRPAPEK